MKTALQDHDYELIKSHALDPENSPLHPALQERFDRVVSAAKLLDKHPVKKQSVALMMAKYPSLSRLQAYRDIDLAGKIFNSFHTFDWDVWQNWLLNDIVQTINLCKNDASSSSQKNRISAQANLIKAIGEKPTDIDDIHRHEKTAYYLLVNLGKNNNVQIDLNNIDKLPPGTLQELNKVLFSGRNIEDAEILDIMDS